MILYERLGPYEAVAAGLAGKVEELGAGDGLAEEVPEFPEH
ncbi:hypothetical protein [Pontibacter ummariensis]|nr:hypothetical protein [Pontibacter ummariensis]